MRIAVEFVCGLIAFAAWFLGCLACIWWFGLGLCVLMVRLASVGFGMLVVGFVRCLFVGLFMDGGVCFLSFVGGWYFCLLDVCFRLALFVLVLVVGGCCGSGFLGCWLCSSVVVPKLCWI